MINPFKCVLHASRIYLSLIIFFLLGKLRWEIPGARDTHQKNQSKIDNNSIMTRVDVYVYFMHSRTMFVLCAKVFVYICRYVKIIAIIPESTEDLVQNRDLND